MRREDLGFRTRAGAVHVAEASLVAPRAVVFAALVDPAGWPRWFPRVRAARYTSAPPHGAGTIREADVGGTRWVEEILVWEPDACWGWTVLRATVPLAAAQVECFDLSDDGPETRVRWTIAMEPRLLGRLGAPFAASTIARLFARAMRNLDAYVAREDA